MTMGGILSMTGEGTHRNDGRGRFRSREGAKKRPSGGCRRGGIGDRTEDQSPKPMGLLLCQFQESRHISSRVWVAFQPRTSADFAGSA